MQIVVANNKGGTGKSTIVASLADVLGADIVDHDNQGTIRVTSSFTGRNVPVDPGSTKRRIVIHDTPPYNASEMKGLFESADLIIIPCKVKYPDLVALKGVIEMIRGIKGQSKSWIVFNDVRKPHSKTYRELRALFDQNYIDIKKATTELSTLVSFTKVFAEPIEGRARDQIKNLVNELCIK